MNAKAKTVLIAEDDVILQKMYKNKFSLEGYEVLLANDGFEALQCLSEHKPDAMLLDIMMPVLGGLQVLERAKEDESLWGVPVIMLTNLSSVDKIGKAVELGAKAYIIKSERTPFEVVQVVNDVIEETELIAREPERWPGARA